MAHVVINVLDPTGNILGSYETVEEATARAAQINEIYARDVYDPASTVVDILTYDFSREKNLKDALYRSDYCMVLPGWNKDLPFVFVEQSFNGETSTKFFKNFQDAVNECEKRDKELYEEFVESNDDDKWLSRIRAPTDNDDYQDYQDYQEEW